ncbi:hypothetical protein CAI21_11320 [Alkalilimnicola ehrlichii]|uniref:AB hydrolase-1 domain-containing protein n=1 Tax=Alkalilimnicola ehrlichii TaxID=351052 RepID=A0A3E0X356_9GAMM|nr:alpha/beta fold hydrolase [Alkalilimnicola ehrlichii]RFA29028.1 hypothetical protein CAI21_11320 [Alkalilimnicola ehrlichii]RFA38664.1 hypothetical protein CAL65_04870 [Alkalilimnicola ehrlichii]
MNRISEQATGRLTRSDVLREAADGGRFRLTFLDLPQPSGAPIVYLPGMFTGRNFWLSERGIGLAAYLAEAGHPGVIVERRRPQAARAGLEEHIRYDLPLVQAEIQQRWERAAFWVGHSFGGVLAARAIGSTLDQQAVAGLVVFASQFEVGKHGLATPGHLLTLGICKLLGNFPARRLGMGPQDEPPAAMQDAVRIVRHGRSKPEIRRTLNTIDRPLLAISGLGDKVDPTKGCERLVSHVGSKDRQFIAAGRQTGFALDYDHPGIVVSKPAQQEIWPIVRDWLSKRAPTG